MKNIKFTQKVVGTTFPEHREAITKLITDYLTGIPKSLISNLDTNYTYEAKDGTHTVNAIKIEYEGGRVGFLPQQTADFLKDADITILQTQLRGIGTFEDVFKKPIPYVQVEITAQIKEPHEMEQFVTFTEEQIDTLTRSIETAKKEKFFKPLTERELNILFDNYSIHYDLDEASQQYKDLKALATFTNSIE